MGRGVVASVLACALLTACSGGGPIEVDDPDLSPADRATCEALVADLPGTLAGQDRVDVEPADALGAAWGDPAYVLTCGVPLPSDYEETAECNIIKGVGWWVPDDQLTDQGEDATPVALSLAPYVEVDVPSDYRAEGIDRALAELAPVLKEHLGEGLSCL
ncbi:DUF3515 domain-containing protein [Nocardioides exalbidus]|uniref:DUF3515 domain-containing protein n=1 Tax=Nocardioides exalbidus TaxID=402596 RepID=UPI000B859903|nr:DUF3515 domain-containing protein [Nocardioides exalbidus]